MEFSPLLSGSILLALFLALVFQGIPIGVAFGVSGFLGIAWARGFDVALSMLGTIPYSWASSPMLIPMPLFIFMGFLAFHSGISKDLYEAAFKWFGRLPGGLAIATTIANAGFGAICGSAQAAAAAMSPIAYPEMNKRGYSKELSTGSLAAGGTLSFLIPPSIPFILYGVLAEVSIGKLFLAGILPGLLLCGLFSFSIYVKCKRNPVIGPPGPSYPFKEKLYSLKGVWGMLVLFLVVMGGLYLGVFSPSEAGSIGAFGAFVIGVVTGRLKLKGIVEAAKESARIVCFVMTIIIGAQIFNTYLGVSGFNRIFAEWVLSLPVSRYVILLLLIIVFILIGMFLDIAAILLLTIPTLAPIMRGLGFDLVWFGVFLILLQSLGFISPPIGLNAFIVQGVTKVPAEVVFRGSLPFVLGLIVMIVLIILFPQICLFLPNLMK
uniref:TRAP transporter large permease n=1 Tax=candidate division WOR-3 bacterium TaxID=2052148 RepID=A0A7C2NZF7_UNCW3